jgi:hypothetical protein
VPSHRTRRDCICWYQRREPFEKRSPFRFRPISSKVNYCRPERSSRIIQRSRNSLKSQHLASESDLNWCMVLRDSKGKRLKRTDRPENDPETKLLSELQAESLKVHGDPLDPPKQPAKKKAE